MSLTTVRNLTQEQRVERSHIDLMKTPAFVAYSGVLMVGSVKVESDPSKCPTAYTNGRDVVYGRDFIAKLTDPELRAVILHENKHKMYRHIATWKHLWKQNAQKANRACDYVINLEIADEGKKSNGFIQLPKCGLYDEKYRGLNSAEVFALLDDDDGGGQGGDGIDEHGWEDAESMSEEEKQELGKQIDQAIRQGAILAGKVGGDISRSFTDLMSAKVDWREALREFVSALCAGKDESTWRKPNRKWLQNDLYLPSSYSETMGRIVVAVDTSGSITGSAVNRFLSEVVGIMNNVNPELVDLLYWDGEVAGHEVYGQGEGDRLMTSTKPKGGGGTSPSCITKYLKDKNIVPECVVVLSDGYVGGDWGGTWSSPVLWCIVGSCKDIPSVGQSIHMED